MKLLTLGGVVGPLLFTAVLVSCGYLRPDYSHATQFISELGARGTQNAAVMNLAGFVLSGLLIAGFGASLFYSVPGGRLSTVAGVLIGAFGLGLVIAGLFPCEPGCPQVSPTLHDGVSILAFLCAIVGSALYARIFRSHTAGRQLTWYSAITSVVALVSLIGLANSIEPGEFTGLWQRLLVGTLFLWCAVVAVRVLAWNQWGGAAERDGAADGGIGSKGLRS